MVRQNDATSDTRGEYARRIDCVIRAAVKIRSNILPWSAILRMQWHREGKDLGKDL